MKKEKIALNGWLNIDKPEGVSSTFITNKLKHLLNPKKIGHAGTLDPAASGILPIALGEATKTIEYLQNARKTYQFTVKFGETTDTLDREGKIIEKNEVFPELNEILNLLPQFTGRIKQTPPAFSAIMVNGERAYDLARKGIAPEIKEREIEVYSLRNLHSVQNNSKIMEAAFECECSKGTYIRVLGADIARASGTIGYITALRRVKVGNFAEDQAVTPKNTEEGLLFGKNEIMSAIKPIDAGLDDIPVLYLDLTAAKKLKNGLKVPVNDKIQGIVRVYNENRLIAIGSNENGILAPVKVFNI